MNKQFWTLRARCARAHLLPLVCATAVMAAACTGDNVFPTEPGGGTAPPAGGTTPATPGTVAARDTVGPLVSFQLPGANLITLSGDSLVTRIRVMDDRALGSLEIAAFGVRGDAHLGTLETVERYAPWEVDLRESNRAVTDTTVIRVLRPNAVADPDPLAFLVATARDTAGNVRADTLRFAVAAPRVVIASPVNGSLAPMGEPLRVRIAAEDRVDGIQSIRLVSLGAVSRDTVVGFAAPLASVDTVIALHVPLTSQGQVQLGAEVLTRSGHRREATPTAVGLGDATRPTVMIVQPATGSTVAVGDSVFVEVHVRDNFALGSVELSGFAVRGDASLGTEQRVQRYASKTVTFADGLAVTDTVLTRYLAASGEAVAENRVFLLARVRDRAGNVDSATVRIAVGGPRAEILAPAAGQHVRAGTQLQVTGVATDRVSQIRRLVLQLNGAVRDSVVYPLATPLDSVQQALEYALPSLATGELRLTLIAENRSGVRAVSREVAVRIDPPIADVTPPTVHFSVESPRRAEMSDSIEVVVHAADDTRVDTVGVFIRPTVNGSVRTVFARGLPVRAGTHRIRVPLDHFGLPADSVVTLDVTAFAVDSAGNCASAIVSDEPSSVPCAVDASGNRAFAARGAQFNVLMVGGRTLSAWDSGDRIVDLVSAGGWVYLSNFSRNRVERLDLVQSGFAAPLNVGSEPWGVALDKSRDTLYVANSGGTSISKLPLSGPQALREQRIQTPDIRLYGLDYNEYDDEVTGFGDEDYSDRPQFLAVTENGRVIYSTRPTSTRVDGTVRIHDPALHNSTQFNRGSQIFVGYGVNSDGKRTLVNADGFELLPQGRIKVWPRPIQHSGPSLPFITGTLSQVQRQLLLMPETDTRILNLDVATIGLRDTTFVAVSGDHQVVAFGEGAADPGRIMLFLESGSGLSGSSSQTRDLVGNAAERVVGLSLNADGKLGMAMGRQVYFFDESLRLQGSVSSGAQASGASFHPEHSGNQPSSRPAYVSGYDASGHPFIEELDSWTFRPGRRYYLRDGVTGSLIAVRVGSEVHVLGITARGVVRVRVDQ
jgi:hypothetical protein